MHVARNNRRRRRLETVTSIGLALVLAPVWAWAADGKERGGEVASGPSAADFAKLQREVAEQRQLIIQMLQMEQQRYDFLLRLLQSGGQAAPGATLPPAPALPGSGATPGSGRGAASKSAAEHGAAADHAAAAATVATVTGRITARA